MKEIIELLFFVSAQFAKAAGVLLIFFVPIVFLILGLAGLIASLVAATKSWRGKDDDEYIVLPFKLVRRLVESLDADCRIADNRHVVLEYTGGGLAGKKHERQCNVYGRNFFEHCRIMLFLTGHETRCEKEEKEMAVLKNDITLSVLQSLKTDLDERIKKEESVQAEAVGNMIEIADRIQADPPYQPSIESEWWYEGFVDATEQKETVI